jgi:serine-protein kinase ATM
MTQELVDGLGALTLASEHFLGIAESIWDLIKENGEKIMTILQVFKHDPLHKWTLGQDKLNKLRLNPMALSSKQAVLESHSIDEAERVLNRIREKLAGIEDGISLSTAGHVNLLIRTATDNELLCQMYPGCQPWM